MLFLFISFFFEFIYSSGIEEYKFPKGYQAVGDNIYIEKRLGESRNEVTGEIPEDKQVENFLKKAFVNDGKFENVEPINLENYSFEFLDTSVLMILSVLFVSSVIWIWAICWLCTQCCRCCCLLGSKESKYYTDKHCCFNKNGPKVVLVVITKILFVVTTFGIFGFLIWYCRAGNSVKYYILDFNDDSRAVIEIENKMNETVTNLTQAYAAINNAIQTINKSLSTSSSESNNQDLLKENIRKASDEMADMNKIISDIEYDVIDMTYYSNRDINEITDNFKLAASSYYSNIACVCVFGCIALVIVFIAHLFSCCNPCCFKVNICCHFYLLCIMLAVPGILSIIGPVFSEISLFAYDGGMRRFLLDDEVVEAMEDAWVKLMDRVEKEIKNDNYYNDHHWKNYLKNKITNNNNSHYSFSSLKNEDKEKILPLPSLSISFNADIYKELVRDLLVSQRNATDTLLIKSVLDFASSLNSSISSLCSNDPEINPLLNGTGVTFDDNTMNILNNASTVVSNHLSLFISSAPELLNPYNLYTVYYFVMDNAFMRSGRSLTLMWYAVMGILCFSIFHLILLIIGERIWVRYGSYRLRNGHIAFVPLFTKDGRKLTKANPKRNNSSQRSSSSSSSSSEYALSDYNDDEETDYEDHDSLKNPSQNVQTRTDKITVMIFPMMDFNSSNRHNATNVLTHTVLSRAVDSNYYSQSDVANLDNDNLSRYNSHSSRHNNNNSNVVVVNTDPNRNSVPANTYYVQGGVINAPHSGVYPSQGQPTGMMYPGGIVQSPYSINGNVYTGLPPPVSINSNNNNNNNEKDIYSISAPPHSPPPPPPPPAQPSSSVSGYNNNNNNNNNNIRQMHMQNSANENEKAPAYPTNVQFTDYPSVESASGFTNTNYTYPLPDAINTNAINANGKY